MVNLIPQFAKKSVTFEYWTRVATVWCLLFSGAFIVATVFVFPSYIFTDIQVGVYEESAKQAEASVINYQVLSDELTRSNTHAQTIIQNSKYPKGYAYVQLFETLGGQGIVLSNINFAKSSSGVEPVTVSGVAVDRESLAAFRDRLLAHEAIISVDLPIANLAKDKDIGFNLKVTMNNEVKL
jgi:hypothetical protein